MAPKWLRTPATLRDLTWAAVALAICIFAIVLLRSLRLLEGRLSAEITQNNTETFEPSRTGTPGGFDPVPAFAATAAEIQYRGTSCLRELSSLEGRLYRACAGRD